MLLLEVGKAVVELVLRVPQLQAGQAAAVVDDSTLVLPTQRLVVVARTAAALAGLAAAATLVVVPILLLAGGLVLAVAQAGAEPEPDTPAAPDQLVLTVLLVRKLVVPPQVQVWDTLAVLEALVLKASLVRVGLLRGRLPWRVQAHMSYVLLVVAVVHFLLLTCAELVRRPGAQALDGGKLVPRV